MLKSTNLDEEAELENEVESNINGVDSTDKPTSSSLYWSSKWEKYKDDEDMSGLSKSQQKKLMKKKAFEETRMERRKLERERKKLKRQQKKEAGIPLPESRRSKKKRKREYSNYKVAVDLDFFELMNDRDHRMVLKQIKACYAENRNHDHPLQLSLTSFTQQFKNLFTTLQPGLVNWDMPMHDGNYLEVYDTDNIVYLTSDSENVLQELDEDKVYIIGGLVDHNQHKGLCYKRANENAIAHAQLPLDQFVQLSTRKVLTINHVFEILLAYSQSKDWKSAFFSVLPQRKGISEKSISSDEQGENEDENEGELVEQCNDVLSENNDNIAESCLDTVLSEDKESEEIETTTTTTTIKQCSTVVEILSSEEKTETNCEGKD